MISALCSHQVADRPLPQRRPVRGRVDRTPRRSPAAPNPLGVVRAEHVVGGRPSLQSDTQFQTPRGPSGIAGRGYGTASGPSAAGRLPVSNRAANLGGSPQLRSVGRQCREAT